MLGKAMITVNERHIPPNRYQSGTVRYLTVPILGSGLCLDHIFDTASDWLIENFDMEKKNILWITLLDEAK